MSGFSVDIDQLLHQAGRFGPEAEELREVGAALKAELERLGQCWGADDAGRNFAASHLEPADAALRQIDTLATEVTQVGDRFRDTARNYQHAERRAADGFTAIHRGQ
ncbi:hypothetical protein D5S17_32530 [Pseudonocardiaceae bacterium YIM PH 21723]|nr:hypothetical protein D5S17_32530 [Pseudonocardiaceae bacterium YIM PH 21723]